MEVKATRLFLVYDGSTKVCAKKGQIINVSPILADQLVADGWVERTEEKTVKQAVKKPNNRKAVK